MKRSACSNYGCNPRSHPSCLHEKCPCPNHKSTHEKRAAMFGSLSLQWIKDGSPNEARRYAELAAREARLTL